MTEPGTNFAFGFGGGNHRVPDAVLDRGQRVEEFELGDQVGLAAFRLGHAGDPHQRRCANRIDNGIVDLAAEFGFRLLGVRHSGIPSCPVGQIV